MLTGKWEKKTTINIFENNDTFFTCPCNYREHNFKEQDRSVAVQMGRQALIDLLPIIEYCNN